MAKIIRDEPSVSVISQASMDTPAPASSTARAAWLNRPAASAKGALETARPAPKKCEAVNWIDRYSTRTKAMARNSARGKVRLASRISPLAPSGVSMPQKANNARITARPNPPG